METLIHKIVSQIMAMIVLFSTMSFAVNLHYCGDKLVEMAIFHEVKGCGMKMQNTSEERCSITKRNCCNDKQLVQNGQDELQLSIDKIAFDQQLFITSFVYTYINLFEGLKEHFVPFDHYSPPLVLKDIQKIDEVYLI